MDPNAQSMNLDQNPFEAIFAQDGQQAPPQQAPQPMPQPAPQVAPGTDEELLGPEQLQPGKTGDNTKPLLGAIQQLHGYIAASTDPGTIQLVRNLISALTQLVARDQKASEQLAQQQEQQVAQPAAQPAQPQAPVMGQ